MKSLEDLLSDIDGDELQRRIKQHPRRKSPREFECPDCRSRCTRLTGEALETLVTDGGQVSPQNIAEEHGRHVDSVRRALKRILELVEPEYGSVSLRSNHVAEMVHDAVQQARDATCRAVEAGAKAIEAAERGIDETTSALVAWCAKHGIDVDDRQEARVTLRLQGVENVEARLKEAYRLWTDAGKDPARFRSAQIDLGERGKSAAWHWL